MLSLQRGRPLLCPKCRKSAPSATCVVQTIAVLLLACGSFSCAAQSSDTLRLSLRDALQSAMEENQDIELSRLQIAKAEAQSRLVKGGFFPQVSVEGRYTRNILRPVFFLPAAAEFPGGNGGGATEEGQGTVIEAGFDNSYQVTAQANFPLFNKELFANVNAVEISENMSRKGVTINQNEARAQVKLAYYDILLAKESLRVLRQRLKNAQKNLENVQNRYSRELVPEFDVIRAEVEVENVKPEIIQAENNYEAAMSNLKLLIGLDEGTPVSLSESLVDFYEEKSDKTVTSFSVQQNPNLQQLNIREKLQEQQINVEQAAYYPSLSAFGNYAYQAQANNFDFDDYRWVNTSAVGLSLNIPVFEGLTRLRRIEQARIDLEEVQMQKSYLEKTLSLRAENAMKRVRRAEASIAAQKRNIEQAEKGYRIAQASYQSGVATLVEVNDAELALTQARLNYVQVVHEYLTALAEFERLTAGSAQ